MITSIEWLAYAVLGIGISLWLGTFINYIEYRRNLLKCTKINV
jgi:hypothetical protein